MTTRNNDNASEKKSKVKIDKLRINKEMVEDLTDKTAEQIKGGALPKTNPSQLCYTPHCTIDCQTP